MTGDFINAFACRVVSTETYRSVILPALADLQFETRTRSTWVRAQSYLGAWAAVGSGLLYDIGIAVQRPGWVDGARTAAGLVLLQIAYYGCMLSLAIPNKMTEINKGNLVVMSAIVVVISTLPVIGLLMPKRHARDH